MIRGSLLFKRSASQRIDDILSRQVDAFLNDAKQRCSPVMSDVSLAQVKDELCRRGVTETDMVYRKCDFSESLQLEYGAYLFDFTRALFPKKKNNHIRLHIKELVFVGALQYSAEDIADLTMDIIGWLPEYENMLDNAQVELKKNELICQLGMTFLQTVAEDISGKGLVCHVWESFEIENTALLSIQHGNGITCEYKIDLLSDFQQKLLDIVVKI